MESQNEIKQLREDIATLTKTINAMETKITKHINFIETVYTYLRQPLDFFKKTIEYTIQKSQRDLPYIDYVVEEPL
jgi:hypothetical protein